MIESLCDLSGKVCNVCILLYYNALALTVSQVRILSYHYFCVKQVRHSRKMRLCDRILVFMNLTYKLKLIIKELNATVLLT